MHYSNFVFCFCWVLKVLSLRLAFEPMNILEVVDLYAGS